eukprot:CAMPEP_0178899104 /NCGR_PEP_ID=MMETSP0786-20121207/2706_1 /TAXON_ID=186022 /ORGANISM="Thalassionema frauenfeldii, Strain CCMP 1798" /LENGTH=148 /DNA_ID=CAMNT_0020569907 /DNA_START=40 /DNA_END=486 /DNA_ORIENTATION=+
MTFRSITSAEEDEIRHAFQLFDAESSGRIPMKDVEEALEDGSLRANAILSQMKDRFFNQDFLTLTEFTELFTYRQNADVNETRRIFQLFDVDRKGYIELKDLKRVTNDLGENSMTDMELQEMIDRASSQGGRVSLEDFTNIMNKKLWT